MVWLRKILFYAFVLLYLIICPLIILRMLGFVPDPLSHQWVKTGIIYVSSNPPDAAVFLNGRRMPETTPTIIRDLTRGTYQLRMELPGYEPWENNVPVVDRKATSVENILLIPKQWDVRVISNLLFHSLVPMPGNNYFLAAADDTAQDIYIVRLDDERLITPLEPLFPEGSIYREAQVVRYYTVDESPFLVLQISLADKHKFLWVDPRERQVHIEDISDLLPDPPQKISWEPNDERNLYAYYPGAVNRIDIKTKAIYPHIPLREIPIPKAVLTTDIEPPKASQAFTINNGNTFLLRRGSRVLLMDGETFGQPRLTRVVDVEEGTDIYFAEKTGRLYYIDTVSHLLSSIQVLHHKPFIPKPIADTLRLKKLEQ